jgi:beta-N-acetylhexosaminidase
MMMMSHAAYPELGIRGPASLSPAAVALLRQDLGFTGVIVSDDLMAVAIDLEHKPAEAAVLAASAGVDGLLFGVRVPVGIAGSLAGAARAGRLDPEALRLSCERITALKQELSSKNGLRG